ncbi:MAG: M20 family metallopeptidase [Lachnospiraceae bacterium]|nr:M20 family metallopeptidase [Lachnospiraceae bacterium]
MQASSFYEIAKEQVDKNRGLYISYLEKAVSFDTTNPPGRENALAGYLKEIMEKSGIPAHLQEVEAGRSNVIGTYDFGKGGKKLLLNAHMDVVAPGEIPWDSDPFVPVIKDGRLYARGAADDKGGLIAMLTALLIFKEIDKTDLNGSIEFCGVMGEEASGIGTKYWLEHGGKVDAAIVGEPSKLEAVIAHRGAYRPQYSFIGQTAHSSEPYLGKNAVYAAAHFIREIEQLNERLAAFVHPLTGAPTVAVTVVNGGKKVNVIPDLASVQLDRRLGPGESLEEAKRQIETILENLQRQGRIGEYRMDKCLNVKGAALTEESEDIVQAVQKTLKENGYPFKTQGMKASTDMFILTDAGIPSVIFAPGDMSIAHMPNESISVDEFLRSIPLYVEIFARYFTQQ